MLTLFRNFAKSKWAVGLLVVLGLALVVTGGTQMDVLGNLGPKHIIKAGDRSVDALEFRSQMDIALRQQREQTGSEVSFEDLSPPGILAQILGQRSQSLGFLAWAYKAGVRPSPELITKFIRQQPLFFDPLTSQFSEERFVSELQQRGLTPEMFNEGQRDGIMERHIGAAIGGGARLPRVYSAVLANQSLATRDARWFTVTQAMAGTAGTPTDAQLTAFMAENADQIRNPEFRSATVILFDNAADVSTAVTEERVAERFRLRQDSLAQPERRTFATLTAPDRATADRIAAALKAGQTPQAVGQANNLQPATYTDTPRTAVADPAIAAAVFGLTANQVSDPIQARVGFVVAQVTGITAGRPVTLADVRPQIVEELQAEAVRAGVYRRVQAYEAARGEGKSVDDAVAQVGARALPVQPVTREGRFQNGSQFNGPPRILESMWTLNKGAASEVIDAGNSQYFVVRLDNIVPAALPPLAEIRGPLAQQWVLRENARLLTDKSNALAARVRGGEDIAAVAASVGAQVQTRTAMSRESQAEVGPGVFRGAFTTAKGEVFSAQQSNDSFVIGRTEAITAPAPALAAPLAQQINPQLSQENMNGVLQTVLKAAAARIEVGYDEPAARVALGLPETAQETPAGAATAPRTPAPAQ
ncbi:peptidyl-prolyl cis-trans isomerase [Brevundimonas sp.]|uniref:peptidyl-prolyl cis-trans isomerase n=1 Tax=Brevundimonas sp. TaxID=1871086 RepID=UPI0035B2E676